MPITTVLFDLDETICEHPRSGEDRLNAAFERADIEPFFDTADIRRWLPKINEDNDLEFRRALFRAIAREKQRDLHIASDLVDAYREPDPTRVQFLPGAKQVLETFASDYRLGLVTNGPRETQQLKLDALDITDAFDTTIFSEPGRPVKPDTEPFERALTLLDASPQTSVHVGNSIRSDVAGANAAGLHSVWVPRPASIVDREQTSVIPDETIETLSQLPAVVSES
ncbi:HAD family hydrolase [Halocatena marina]|uniref:HAD family hydrolase n=1 Tax=Halocatena marina TaxID=2934937 RepID=UPI002010B448|nr:HAD family hydrolase [Halocatena marina]